MTPLDLAKRACRNELKGELDWHWIALWLNDYAMEATIRATPRPGSPTESGAPSAEQSATTPAPRGVGGFSSVQTIECDGQ